MSPFYFVDRKQLGMVVQVDGGYQNSIQDGDIRSNRVSTYNAVDILLDNSIYVVLYQRSRLLRSPVP